MPYAKYPGTCKRCHGPINTGDKVQFFNRPMPRTIFHDACVARPEPMPQPSIPQPTPNVTPEPAKPALPAPGSLDAIVDARIAAKLEGFEPSQSVTQDTVIDLVQAALDSKAAPTTINVDVTRADGSTATVEGAHAALPALLKVLRRRRHAYLHGPAGSGKSTAAKQAAEAMGLEYGYISLNPQTPDSRLQGFIDATGVYRDPVFRKLYAQGGVFCIDEADNAAGSLLTTMNSALENGHAAFPDGMVARHENFVMVATGNTAGLGANPAYPERRPFDAAFRDRFVYISWGYDEAMERRAALAVNPGAAAWINWVQSVRKWAADALPRLVITPRASIVGADLLNGGDFSPAEVAEMTAFKGLDKDSRDKVLAACPLPKVA